MYNTKRRLEMRAIIDKAKDCPCLDCNIKYPTYVMQFDHVRGVKTIAIGSATARLKDIARLNEEIAKCEVVCANCHAERTFKRKQIQT